MKWNFNGCFLFYFPLEGQHLFDGDQHFLSYARKTLAPCGLHFVGLLQHDQYKKKYTQKDTNKSQIFTLKAQN